MRSLAYGLAVVLGVPPAAGASQDVVRRNIQGVRIDVTVTDDGRPVLGLAAKDFEVLDKGVPQLVETIRSPKQLSVVFALDTSASVTAGRMEFHRTWHETPENFNQLIAAVRAVVSRLKEGDEVSLITFSDRLRLAVPPTTDVQQIEEAIQNPAQLVEASAQIRSTVWDATVAAAALAAGRPERSVVILLSDGTDNASWLSQADAITAAERAGVVIDVIWVPRTYDTLDEDPPGSWDVEAISERTGGEAFSARDRDLSRNIAERLDVLRSGYVLTFTPNASTSSEGWHPLEVRLRGRAGRIKARSGYYFSSRPPIAPGRTPTRSVGSKGFQGFQKGSKGF